MGCDFHRRPFFVCFLIAGFFALAFFRVFELATTVADSANSASISSTVGREDFKLGGRARVSSYSEMPMGLLGNPRAKQVHFLVENGPTPWVGK
jgi:hypothetical protein